MADSKITKGLVSGTFQAEFEISASSAGVALFYIGIKSNFKFSTPFEKLSEFEIFDLISECFR